MVPVGPARGVQRDVGADHRVDLVLDHAAARSCGAAPRRARDQRRSTPPCRSAASRGPRRPAPRGGRSASAARAQLVERAARLVLVLQRPAEPEQRHRRRMRVDLDRPPGAARRAGPCRAPAASAQPGTARVRGNSGLPVLDGCAPASNWRSPGSAPPRRAGCRWRCVTTSGASMATRHGPSTYAASAVDGSRRRCATAETWTSRPVLVEHGQPGGPPLAPGEVDPDVVHATLHGQQPAVWRSGDGGASVT